jgi:hypothetical protein
MERQRKLDFQTVRVMDALGSVLLDRLVDCGDPRVGPHEDCTCDADIDLLQRLEGYRSHLWPHNRSR